MFIVVWWAFVAVWLYLQLDTQNPVSLEVQREVFLTASAYVLPSALILIFPAVVISAVFGSITGRWLDRRLEDLRSAAEAWKEGDFSIQVSDPADDEIGQLGRRLNNMAAQLESLFQTRQELATLEERNRMARDLHDSVKQQMVATAMQLSAAQAIFERDPEAAQECLKEAENLSHQAQRELTDIIRELRPPGMDGKGLPEALREYTAAWSKQSGVGAKVSIQVERSLESSIELPLFRVAQEALANVRRHSGANQVELILETTHTRVTLTIHDDGCGFDVDQVQGHGFGLGNMVERIQSLQGEFTLKSGTGQGTMLTARIPLEPRTEPSPPVET
jgi:NarL family two-component system sensor histidine kinase LiaS